VCHTKSCQRGEEKEPGLKYNSNGNVNEKGKLGESERESEGSSGRSCEAKRIKRDEGVCSMQILTPCKYTRCPCFVCTPGG